MEFGVVFPHNEIGTDPDAIKAYAQGAEALGATHMLIYDHVLGADPDRPGGWQGPYDKDTAFHEPMTTFAYIAAVTERIQMGTNVLILPQRQTALLAKQAAEVDLLSRGRLRLGVGTGWNQIEYEALNEEFKTRGKRQVEQVELLRKLWAEDSLTFDGRYHKVSAASINPRPERSIPIWFGGHAPVVLKRCAEMGDGWIPIMGPSDTAAACIETLKQHRAEAGLSWEDFGIQAQIQTRGASPEKWADACERWDKLGATHIAIVTHTAGFNGVDEHLGGIEAFLRAVG